MQNYLNFIDNDFIVENADGQSIIVCNPATEEPVAQVACASQSQAVHAVDVAARAQKAWRRLSAAERGAYLYKLADALIAHAPAIGAALSLESGKSMSDANSEVLYAAEITRYHAQWARRIEGEIIPSDNPGENLLLHRAPIGVVACLIPFNFPVYTLLRKIAPALITGNTVVVRPSNHTPCCAFEIARAVLSAGLPAGVVNVVAMHHATAAVLCTQAAVGMISLTGSVNAGRAVLDYAKVNIAKTSLELGGKTPAIVAADANLEQAAREIAASRTRNCGQLCTAVERVYVESGVYAPMYALLKKELAASIMGPLISAQARHHIHGMVERAVAGGATLELGGEIPSGPGYFYPPTLLGNCRQDAEIVQEEIFGPVLCVLPCDSLEHALEMANDHQFGLSSVLYTENYRAAMHFANEIEAGELYINRTPADPYQGYHAGWKRSGLGGDDGKHGMLEFTQTRLVIMKY